MAKKKRSSAKARSGLRSSGRARPTKGSKKRRSRTKKSRTVGRVKTSAIRTKSKPKGRAGLRSAVAEAVNVIDQITALAAASKLARYKWKDDGDRAPLAYIKGMSVVYARVYCKLKAGDPAAVEMAKAKTDDPDRDVLAFYDESFAEAGMSNENSGSDTLRHLFVLLVGLGIRESSGRYCMGRYMEQDFDTADSAEAGLFQASFDVTRHTRTILTNLFDQYSANSAGFVEIFKVGITCNQANWKNWGDPSERGYRFQQLTKTCPAFAAEFAAVGLRNHRTTWGPINRKIVEIVHDCDALFKEVQTLMESNPGLCSQVL